MYCTFPPNRTAQIPVSFFLSPLHSISGYLLRYTRAVQVQVRVSVRGQELDIRIFFSRGSSAAAVTSCIQLDNIGIHIPWRGAFGSGFQQRGRGGGLAGRPAGYNLFLFIFASSGRFCICICIGLGMKWRTWCRCCRALARSLFTPRSPACYRALRGFLIT